MIACPVISGVECLQEKAGVATRWNKKLKEHCPKRDITNGVYGHRGVVELRREKNEVVML